MDLYFYLCGTMLILSAFGVIEHTLKINKINRIFITLFFLLNLIFYFLPNIYLFGINFNLNIFLYIFVCVLQLFKKNSLKSFFSCVLVCVVTISVLVCYNAICPVCEYSFVTLLVYISLAMGGLLFCICKSSFSAMFVGTTLGAICFEIVTLDLQKYVLQDLVFFDTNIMTYILCSCLSYCFVCSVVYMIKSIKLKKEQKNLIN